MRVVFTDNSSWQHIFTNIDKNIRTYDGFRNASRAEIIHEVKHYCGVDVLFEIFQSIGSSFGEGEGIKLTKMAANIVLLQPLSMMMVHCFGKAMLSVRLIRFHRFATIPCSHQTYLQ
jgi:hypothetical protein